MRINKKIKNFRLPFLLAAAFCLGWPFLANAIIVGPCSTCHTMHNSQENTLQAFYNPAEWNASNALSGALSVAPLSNLLKTDCVGCHSSATASTIITTGAATKIPIVFNSVPPGPELAGGNFYWTSPAAAGYGNNYGHNVLGIAARDPLPGAPGATGGTCGQSCHGSLVDAVVQIPSSGENQTGCEGCHLKVGHHQAPELAGTGAGNAYRFLSGHGDGLSAIVDNGLGTYEGTQWGLEGSGDPLDRNIYKSQTTSYKVGDVLTIGRWCAGCHGQFHAYGAEDDVFLIDNGGDLNHQTGIASASPWMRHPTNVFLTNTGEFSGVIGTAYEPQIPGGIPLARNSTNRTANIGTGDQVMCLSCHKAHGSKWPNALRFDYTGMDAHLGTGTRTDGCFFCHRLKDDP